MWVCTCVLGIRVAVNATYFGVTLAAETVSAAAPGRGRSD